MVWGVCRRLLANHHDAEDAFQATFLVLVRKAASIVPREMVGNWLYGVANQTALKARALAAKRRTREKQVVAMPEPAAADGDLWRDLQPALDAELRRLPETYRAAIVVCDLEGRTRKEAARQLGWPEGTVATRLTRGRALLARRLQRHGLVVGGAVLGAVCSQATASAAVPAGVVSATIKAATGDPTGVSANIARLTDAVVKAFFLKKLKTVSLALLGAALILLLAGFGLSSLNPDAPPEQAPVPAHASQTSRPPAGAPAAVSAPVKARTDREVLQGTWRLVKMVVPSKNGPVTTTFEENKGLLYEFKDEKLVVTALGKDGFGDGAILADPELTRVIMSAYFGDRGAVFGKIDPEQLKKLMEQFNAGGGAWGKMVSEFVVKLDEKANPRTMDQVVSVSGMDYVILKGVYALQGDTLTIWNAAGLGAERPTAEDVAAGTNCTVSVFERVRR
jgi:RNA polymerase sigma factor (sigma-70 family)